MQQKITPFLWFNNNAEEAVNYYTSIFKDSKILHTSRYGEAGPGPTGSLMTAAFMLNGQEFAALNGGPQYNFTEAISFVVSCDTQEEVDYYWNTLAHEGVESRCGWLKDKFGISWQIIPKTLMKLLQDKDPAKSKRVLMAMLEMSKIDIAKLEAAHLGTEIGRSI